MLQNSDKANFGWHMGGTTLSVILRTRSDTYSTNINKIGKLWQHFVVH